MVKIPVNIIKGLNLSEAQVGVYMAALELGQATMQALAKKSGVRRTTIYTFIDDLVDRGLLLETRKRKRTLYSAAHPEQLVELEKIHLADMQSMLPELLAIYNVAPHKPKVTFYSGIDGIKEVYADTLRQKQEIVGWSDYEQSRKVLGSYYETYGDERAKKGILYRGIARDTAAAREKIKLTNRQLRDIRLSKRPEITTELYIYGDKITLINFRTTPLFAVIIADVSIAATLRAIWEEAWLNLSA